MPDDPKPDDDELYFDELLGKRGEKWLTAQLEKFKAELATNPSSTSQSPPADFAGFLSAALKETKTEAQNLREKLDAALDLLTPEQRTLLRSAKSASADDRKSVTPNAPPENPSNPGPNSPENPAAPARRFLKRL